MNHFTLSELLNTVNEVVKLHFEETLWVRAEIGELHENNAHAYLELIENAENTDKLLAKIRATCWATTWKMLKPYFEETSGQTLRAGLTVLVAVTVEFHSVYGISLNIKDIEPSFTIGEMALRRQQIIRLLENEGVAEMNRSLPFPPRPQRLAVISSAIAAGYGDFMHQLNHNTGGFRFYTVLFVATMQGESAAKSIIAALERVFENADLFDAVVLIRGGGATSDLACFDSYDLALNLVQFPLPILAGIGHQRDSTIADLVAHRSLKTPTAVAEFLINQMLIAESELFEQVATITTLAKNALHNQNSRLEQIRWRISHRLQSKTEARKIELDRWQMSIAAAARRIVEYQKNRCVLYEKSITAHSPLYLLGRGYTLTTCNGKRLVSVAEIQKGDLLTTHFHDGTVDSIVHKLQCALPKKKREEYQNA